MFYIRFGDIPENEESCVHAGDLGVVRREVGVSVYNYYPSRDNFHIVLPSVTQTALNDLLDFLVYCKPRPIYLVSGKVVGYGSTGEPCLKNVKIEAELEIVELERPITLSHDRVNAQLRIKRG